LQDQAGALGQPIEDQYEKGLRTIFADVPGFDRHRRGEFDNTPDNEDHPEGHGTESDGEAAETRDILNLKTLVASPNISISKNPNAN
jgi:hypothetical protein